MLMNPGNISKKLHIIDSSLPACEKGSVRWIKKSKKKKKLKQGFVYN